jgi:hypothetical protein
MSVGEGIGVEARNRGGEGSGDCCVTLDRQDRDLHCNELFRSDQIKYPPNVSTRNSQKSHRPEKVSHDTVQHHKKSTVGLRHATHQQAGQQICRKRDLACTHHIAATKRYTVLHELQNRFTLSIQRQQLSCPKKSLYIGLIYRQL